MKYLPIAFVLTTLFILSGCNEPFDEDADVAYEQLNTLLGKNAKIENAISLIEGKGFECTNKLTPWATEYLPDEINDDPMPYFCSSTRTTVPFVCSEYWTIYLGHINGLVQSTFVSKSEQSCL